MSLIFNGIEYENLGSLIKVALKNDNLSILDGLSEDFINTVLIMDDE